MYTIEDKMVTKWSQANQFTDWSTCRMDNSWTG